MEIQVGQAVELMAVENAGIDITGKRGLVMAIPGHGLVSVALDGSGAVVSVWPENLKILKSSDPTPATHTTKDCTGSEPTAKGESDPTPATHTTKDSTGSELAAKGE